MIQIQAFDTVNRHSDTDSGTCYRSREIDWWERPWAGERERGPVRETVNLWERSWTGERDRGPVRETVDQWERPWTGIRDHGPVREAVDQLERPWTVERDRWDRCGGSMITANHQFVLMWKNSNIDGRNLWWQFVMRLFLTRLGRINIGYALIRQRRSVDITRRME